MSREKKHRHHKGNDHRPASERPASTDVADLEDGADHAASKAQLDNTHDYEETRFGDQDQELAVAQPRRDFRCGLLARELAEVFLDVLDFERTRVERVLLDQVFQRVSVAYRILLRGGHVPDAMTTTNGLPARRTPVHWRIPPNPAAWSRDSSSPAAKPVP
jgi:hypothetical protein